MTIDELNKSVEEILSEIEAHELEKIDIYMNDYQVKEILKLFKYLKKTENVDFAKNLYKDIVTQQNNDGKIYEALAYAWLIEKGILFEPQPKISANNCFKNKEYLADGLIKKSNVYFDIKQFGIGSPLIEILCNKLQEKAKGFHITIGGANDLSVQVIKDNYLCRIDDLFKELFSEEHLNFEDYIFTTKDGLEIRAHKIKQDQTNVFLSVSSFNAYEWAENNEFYFLKHGSQFCINNPFIIICHFDDIKMQYFATMDANSVHVHLRLLCRRIFVHLMQMEHRKLIEFDHKARDGVSVSTASRKITAIIFVDVTKEHTYNHCRTWVYINPNADNKIYRHQTDNWFKYIGAFIDDFEHDNY